VPRIRSNDVPIQAQLKRLHLQRSGGGKSRNINPGSVPSIIAHVESFKYAELELGTMEFAALAGEDTLTLEKLSLLKPSLTIQATGQWRGNDISGTDSDFNIQVHAAEFSAMLDAFGYDIAAIDEGETQISIDANWQGSPLDFSLDKLNGTLGLKIEQGQLLNVQPAAGRLFGLLSLQALPRRLVLDFSDLFGKGMAFDSIQGNFLIENGNAYTSDLLMKGPSADINITGRTGLSEQDYDQRATITPQISDSLAVASGFLGPVGIGLGAVLYLAGNIFEPLQDSINKIMKFEYTITGKWNEPVIERSRTGSNASG
jgi:uncharacterized protein YhdP